MMTFIESPAFTRLILQLLDEDEYRSFQNHLAENPAAGDVIPGMAGLRKISIALPGRGKRGGGRVLYLVFFRAETIFMVTAYTKGEFDNLPPGKLRRIRELVIALNREFEK